MDAISASKRSIVIIVERPVVKNIGNYIYQFWEAGSENVMIGFCIYVALFGLPSSYLNGFREAASESYLNIRVYLEAISASNLREVGHEEQCEWIVYKLRP